MKSPMLRLILIFFACAFKLESQVSFTISPSLCLNDTSLLIANTGSLSNVTYTWSSFPTGANFTSISSPTTSITFTTAANYTISLKIKSGSIVDSTAQYVTVFSLPNIILSKSSLTTCIESNFPLFSQPIHLTATGGISYTWTPPPAPSMTGGNPNGPLNDVRPTTSSCFSITGIDTNGCRSMTNTCINVLSRFSITATPNSTTICFMQDPNGEGPAMLTMGNPSPPAFGLPNSYTYTWTSSTGGLGILTTPFAPTIFVYHSSTITFTAEIRDSLGCVSLPATATVISQNCTDVSEIGNEINFTLYPNPAREVLYLDLKGINEEVSISITDLAGRVVFKTDQFPSEHEISLRQLQTGIYLANLIGKEFRKTVKIVKE